MEHRDAVRRLRVAAERKARKGMSCMPSSGACRAISEAKSSLSSSTKETDMTDVAGNRFRASPSPFTGTKRMVGGPPRAFGLGAACSKLGSAAAVVAVGE